MTADRGTLLMTADPLSRGPLPPLPRALARSQTAPGVGRDFPFREDYKHWCVIRTRPITQRTRADGAQGPTSASRGPGRASSPPPPRASAGGGGRSAPISADGAPGGSFIPRPGGPADGADDNNRHELEEGAGLLSGETPDSPLNRLRNRRSYWQATMRQMGTLCALTLSIVTSGYQMEWDPLKGPASPVHLRNHNSAFAETTFVTEAVAAGVAAGIMVACDRSVLRCILPLGVAYNRVGKRRLIWDGQHVNAFLIEKSFRMETLQKEGRTLFEQSSYGGTINVSSAYHHVEMHETAHPFLGFEWGGIFYKFIVLPFGISTAPRIFSLVMGHCVRFLRYKGVSLISFLDDLIFAHATGRGAIQSAQLTIRILRQFGWLIHPTKCVGTTEATQSFIALGTLVNLAARTYAVPADKVSRILDAAQALLTGPPRVGVRTIARLKGLVSSTWLATGSASRIRTREMDIVINSRPAPKRQTRGAMRATWKANVVLTIACLSEIAWWVTHLRSICSAPIRPRPWDVRFDSTLFSDASDKGVGAVALVEGPDAAASSFLRYLRGKAPPDMQCDEVVRYACRGIQFYAPLPRELLDASSTLRELYGIYIFLTAVAAFLAGGRHRVILDNLGCVFIMGGIVPPFAVGGKQWGEFVSGGSPNPALQRYATSIFDLGIRYGFELMFEWRPREQNVLADYLSHVIEMLHHHYGLQRQLFRDLDDRWGPHTIDRFATVRNRQVPRFNSQYFHPESGWTDAFSLPWAGENNWLFPPVPQIARTIRHIRASKGVGTLIMPEIFQSDWWALIREGQGWSTDVVETSSLGSPWDALTCARSARNFFRSRPVIAVRLDCRNWPDAR